MLSGLIKHHVTRRGIAASVLFLPIILTWWPSHYLFKWIRKKSHSINAYILCIVICTVVSVALIMLGLELGRHTTGSIKSLGATSGGKNVDINFMWVPFCLLSLGIWAGFLSGFTKMKILDDR